MIWSDKHEIVGGSFQLFTFHQISSTKSPQSLTIAGLLDFRCNFTTLEVGKGFWFYLNINEKSEEHSLFVLYV